MYILYLGIEKWFSWKNRSKGSLEWLLIVAATMGNLGVIHAPKEHRFHSVVSIKPQPPALRYYEQECRKKLQSREFLIKKKLYYFRLLPVFCGREWSQAFARPLSGLSYY